MKTIPFIHFSLYEMFLIFSFWSIIGWIIEVIDIAIETKKLENRGFLHIPFCPMYGFGVLGITILLRGVKNNFAGLFIGSTILCTALELAVGVLFEKLFHKRWWDYSHMKFNYRGLICLRNSLLFGFGCVGVEGIVEPAVERKVDAIPVNVGVGFICVMCVIILVDSLVSLHKIRTSKCESHVAEVDESDYANNSADNLEEIDDVEVSEIKIV